MTQIGRMNADKIRKNPRESVASAQSAANRIVIFRGAVIPAWASALKSFDLTQRKKEAKRAGWPTKHSVDS